MRIGIIGWDREESETLALVDYGRAYGYEVTLFTLEDVVLHVDRNVPRLYAGQTPAHEFNAIVSRAQVSPASWSADYEKLLALEHACPVLLDSPGPFLFSESKLLTMQKLARAGFTVPDTRVCRTLQEVKESWLQYGRVVLKPSYGYGGNDIERIMGDFEKELPVVVRLLEKHGLLLVQEYLPHPEGDVRATVVGDELVFSIRRIPNEKTWKANICLGASAESYEPPRDIVEVSLAAAREMGLSIAGIDIIRHNGKLYLMEVNNVPGWLTPNHDERMGEAIFRHARRQAEQPSGR